jgi:hypothetical protein
LADDGQQPVTLGLGLRNAILARLALGLVRRYAPVF